MIAQDSRGRDPLVTFRVGERIDQLPRGRRVEAERIADHRVEYLTYEGPLSGDRGTVTRLARGEVVSIEIEPSQWRVEIRWLAADGTGSRCQVLRVGRQADCESWILEILDAS